MRHDRSFGVTTQDPRRYWALVVEDKYRRVANLHKNTLHALKEAVESSDLAHPSEFTPHSDDPRQQPRGALGREPVPVGGTRRTGRSQGRPPGLSQLLGTGSAGCVHNGSRSFLTSTLWRPRLIHLSISRFMAGGINRRKLG